MCVTPGVTAGGHSISIRFPNPHDSWRTFKYLLVSHYFCQWKLSLGNKAFQLIGACVLLKNLTNQSVILKIKQHSHIILVYGWYMGTWALLAAVSNLIGTVYIIAGIIQQTYIFSDQRLSDIILLFQKWLFG